MEVPNFLGNLSMLGILCMHENTEHCLKSGGSLRAQSPTLILRFQPNHKTRRRGLAKIVVFHHMVVSDNARQRCRRDISLVSTSIQPCAG